MTGQNLQKCYKISYLFYNLINSYYLFKSDSGNKFCATQNIHKNLLTLNITMQNYKRYLKLIPESSSSRG